MTGANYAQVAPSTNSLTVSSDQYNTAYTFDRNGNIKSLTRNGLLANGTFGQIDNLAYNYSNDGALASLTETSEKEIGLKSKTNDGIGLYTYDGNGNMVTDEHKSMTVTYNFLNLPTKVTKSEGTIEWIYDATGTKLSKTVTTDHLKVNVNSIFSKKYQASTTIESNGNVPNDGNVTFTAGGSITLKEGFTATSGSDFLARIMPNEAVEVRDYCSGIEYFKSELEAIYHAGGRVKYDNVSSEREYVLSDYQANVRTLFKDAGNGLAEAIESYSYYPNGALFGQSNFLNNNYTHAGKELQMELDLGWSDYGTRCFDNWSSKWLGTDILAEYNAGHSPYSFNLGNAIRFSDPTGMISEDEDGLMQVSTDLWGDARNQDFMNQSASNAQQRANINQNRQAGYITSGSGSGIGNGQLSRDMRRYKVEFNKHGGDEVSRELVGSGVDITFEGSFNLTGIAGTNNKEFKKAVNQSIFRRIWDSTLIRAITGDAWSINLEISTFAFGGIKDKPIGGLFILHGPKAFTFHTFSDVSAGIGVEFSGGISIDRYNVLTSNPNDIRASTFGGLRGELNLDVGYGIIGGVNGSISTPFDDSPLSLIHISEPTRPY